jgi:glutaredoxin-like protein
MQRCTSGIEGIAWAGVDAISPDHAEITATATQSVRLTANRIREHAEKSTRDREQIAVLPQLMLAVNETNAIPAPISHPEITVYWRPGCGFCGRLFRTLEDHDIAHRRINIWDDETAAAIVRSIARGNETVPTVVVGDMGMVNPSVQQIIDAVHAAKTADATAEPVA